MQLSTVIAARLRALEARASESEARLCAAETSLQRLMAREGTRRKAMAPTLFASGNEAAGAEEPAGYSVNALCQSMGGSFGRSTLYALWRAGQGPDFVRVKGRRLITREQRAAWLRKLEEQQRARESAEAEGAESAEAEGAESADGPTKPQGQPSTTIKGGRMAAQSASERISIGDRPRPRMAKRRHRMIGDKLCRHTK
jgi:hypothetical protein